MGDGLLLTSLMGLHAGTNAVSGDFSLSAEGFRIKGGRIDTPVEQITVAGNFYQLLAEVKLPMTYISAPAVSARPRF